jgi:hypothetical protein
MVMEDADAPGTLLSVWDPAAETRDRVCADAPSERTRRGGGCGKNAVWGMCRAGAQGTAGVLERCARTCGRCVGHSPSPRTPCLTPGLAFGVSGEMSTAALP